MKTIIQNLIIFSIAMALLEASVVVYLRELYYPEGFTVAMKLIKDKILITELAREIATLIMLYCIAILAGKNTIERFAFFLLVFATWDIFYYLWLKVFLNWPISLFTWDILFLVPITWLSPLLAPIICSLTMILLCFTLIEILNKKIEYKIITVEWILLCGGSMLILCTFMKDYSSIIIQNGWVLEMDQLLYNQKFIELSSSYIPVNYDWLLFGFGEGIILITIAMIYVRSLEFKSSNYTGL